MKALLAIAGQIHNKQCYSPPSVQGHDFLTPTWANMGADHPGVLMVLQYPPVQALIGGYAAVKGVHFALRHERTSIPCGAEGKDDISVTLIILLQGR